MSENMLRRLAAALVMLLSVLLPQPGIASCGAPANPIEAENCLPGTPSSNWDIPGAGMGDPTIQGFATDISVNRGSAIAFKVNTPALAWTLDIYRLGWYGGNGARLVTTLQPSAALPQLQPPCQTDSVTLLTDCGNWSVSASWNVPATATTGVYIGKLTRSDTGGVSHMIFVVRDDSSTADILFKTSDATWQAYNHYSTNFYDCSTTSNCRAYKVSYNRPFTTRSSEPETWVFNAEYPMIGWLESNGYNVAYSTDLDSDRNGALIRNHKVLLSNGHDEYWSGGQRANVEAAIGAGVNFAAFSGNTSYWKTRWESAIDGSGTPYRTLVCYKETWANARIDPLPAVWTGTWRDPRFSPPADGGRPENALLGSLTIVAAAAIGDLQVPAADGRMRLWRNTAVAAQASGQTMTLAPGTLSSELDTDVDNGSRPPGLFHLSSTPITSANVLLDYGSTVGLQTITHNTTMYRNSSGALVFASGAYDWAWGLDSDHDRSGLGAGTDPSMQQATVNLLADMGVQPATLQAGLAPATASTDHLAPASLITSPASGSTLPAGAATTITGIASDSGGGVVGAVEVSTDGGRTWHPASGRESWSYAWVPDLAGSVSVLSRAVDDSGNLEKPGSGVNVTVSGTSFQTVFPANPLIAVPDVGPDSPTETGLRFTASAGGYIRGVRFYKAAANTGTHIGSLWSSSGSQLASVTFNNETASGWQQALFATPVAIAAGTVYVVSVHGNLGHYSASPWFFASNGVSNGPLAALGTDASGSNGVYAYAAASSFPNSSYAATNYWVDAVYSSTAAPAAALNSIAVGPPGLALTAGATQQLTATGSYADGSVADVAGSATWASSNSGVAKVANGGLLTAVAGGTVTVSATVGTVTGSLPLTIKSAPLQITTSALPAAYIGTSYSASLSSTGGNAPVTWKIAAGKLPAGLTLNASSGAISGVTTTAGTTAFTVQVTDASKPALTITRSLSIVSSLAPVSIWPATALPALVDAGPDNPVELGVKFSVDTAGSINGIRFYKGANNTGVHVGNLWNASGALLATVTFSAESASGWQQANFSAPVAVSAGATYIASYHSTSGHYSYNAAQFATVGVDSPPLHALASPVAAGNGVYAYGTASVFPNQSYNATNYWVDVAYVQTPVVFGITTAVLPGATTGFSYAASLNASGGLTPYHWSVSTGVLPAGITLNAATGVLSGKPAAAGSFPFTVRVTDSSVPAQTATAAYTLAVAGSSSVSLWPATTVPAVLDAGADSPVELGVKFSADTAGHIAGIRFYKSAANSGTHVAHLWTAGGTLLATATFTAETGSGWQQASFPTPVAIAAGTVYVASYHVTLGHYSFNSGYFTGKAVDSPPLHAPADGSPGGNGVFAYGSGGFPSQSYQAGNYWVDVVYTP